MKKLILLSVLIIFTGCSWFSTLNPANLTDNKAQANFTNRTFLMAWDDYQYHAKLPNLTDNAKQLLRQKRVILANMIDISSIAFPGPIIKFNQMVEGGELITDADWASMLDKLLDLDNGWYTNEAAYVGKEVPHTLGLAKEQTTTKSDDELIEDLEDAGLWTKAKAKIRAIWEGVLLELIRTGIHAIRAMLEQKGLDEAQMASAWQSSWDQVKALNTADLVVIQ